MAYALLVQNPDTNRFGKVASYKTKAEANKSIRKNLAGLPKKHIRLVEVIVKKKPVRKKTSKSLFHGFRF